MLASIAHSPHQPSIIAVVSPVDNTAKTTTAVNLAITLAASGQTVLLVDLDPKAHASGTLVRGRHEPGGTYRLLTDAAITRGIIAATEIPDLYLIPADETLNHVEIELSLAGDSRTRLHQALGTLSALSTRIDSVILDCPQGLGLVTLNALTAARRVLVLVDADHAGQDSLPALLKSINRLRAGMSQPLLGVHLLVTLHGGHPDQVVQVDQLRQSFGQMCLHTELPWSDSVREAASQNKPVIVHAPRSDISQAYLALAGEWIALDNPATRSRHLLLSQIRQDMQQRIEAWLVDPTSLLFDANEANRHPDAQVLEELFTLTRQIHEPKISTQRLTQAGLAIAATIVLLGLTLWVPFPQAQFDRWRLEAGALLIGSTQYWLAGSTLLARSDEAAYRELVLAAKLVEENRTQLQNCTERAQESASPVPCPVHVEPWH